MVPHLQNGVVMAPSAVVRGFGSRDTGDVHVTRDIGELCAEWRGEGLFRGEPILP